MVDHPRDTSGTEELASLRASLPAGTSKSWRALAPVIPQYAYLAGGTALAVHLRHRISRDLDFFTERPFDPSDLTSTVQSAGTFAPTLVDEGTLSGICGSTKVQFLDASTQTLPEERTRVACRALQANSASGSHRECRAWPRLLG